MTFSKDSKLCRNCKHFYDCDNKRMEACAYVAPKETLAQPIIQPLTEPLAEDIAVKHDYREIKIAENTTVTIDLEKLKKDLENEIYKQLGCDFLQEG